MMIAKGFGGAERYFVDLSLALADLGHQVQVICHDQFAGMQLLRSRTDMNIQAFRVRGWWDIWARKNIEKAMIAFAPEVIHAHLARGACLAGRISASTGIPLVVKTHNYVKLKYYKNVAMFLPTTIDQKKYLEEKGIDPGIIRVIPNFSSIPPVTEVTTVACDQSQIICSLGRMVKKKGFDILIKALKEIAGEAPDIVLHLGGDGPERGHLQQLCNDLKVNDRVIFTGWVNDVGSFLREASLFVLPSYDEPFGIVILEAMSQGTPIVSTPTQGPCEILDNEIAWFVGAGNVDALAKTILSAMKDKNMRMHKAQKALDKFRSTYARERIVPELVGVYQKLAG